MKIYSSEEIRNIVLLGHGGSGKTTLVEAMAHEIGITKRQGKVDDGTTISDFDKEEIKRAFSISTSCIPIEWKKNKINVLDAPGYFDFAGETMQAIRVADSGVILVSGKAGVEVGTEKAWEYVEEANLPKMIFISDMDDDNANVEKVLDQLNELFGDTIVPFQLPIHEGEHVSGLIDVINMTGSNISNGKLEKIDVPESMKDSVEEAREKIMELIAETSEELMEKYFDGVAFTEEEIRVGIHQGILSGSLVPVMIGSGITKLGVKELLDSIVEYMPTPKDKNPSVIGVHPETGEELEITCDQNQPTSAFVFKTIMDPYVGKLSLFRVYSGSVKSDSQLINTSTEETERISHVYVLRGKEQIGVAEIKAGDIGAVAKLNQVSTGDTLCDKEKQVKLAGINYPESLAYRAIVPKVKGDEDKIGGGVYKLIEEDPTIKFVLDHENRQELIYGVGGQHLDVIVSKLESRFKVLVDLKKPRIPYRETIKKKVEVRGRHKKQSGGHGQYGDVVMEFEPSGQMEVPYIFEERIVGGAVPKNYFPAVDKGLSDSVKRGILAGYPVVGIKATLIDGSYHPVDSSEMAFKLAAQIAFKEAMAQATPTLLEPIASIRVIVPDAYMGDIIGDLNKRRGKVLGINPDHGKQEIIAEVPMGELYGYSTDLRSLTQSRGIFSQKFERYEEAPREVQEKVIADKENEE